MTLEDQKHTIFYYTICLRGSDAMSSLHGMLYEFRREYQQNGKKLSGKKTEIIDGTSVIVRYLFSSKNFFWEAKSGRLVLERSFRLPEGWCVRSWNEEGTLLRQVTYGKGLEWLQSAYFGADGVQQTVLSPLSDINGLSLYEYEPESKRYRLTRLLGCPVSLGTPTNSLLNSAAGEPLVYASTSSGDFCYCTEEQRTQRQKVTQQIQEGTLEAEPSWAPDAPKEEPVSAEEEPAPAEEKPVPAEEKPVEPAVPEQKEEARQEETADASYSVDHEVFHVDAAPETPPTRYTVAARRMDGTVISAQELRKEQPEAPGQAEAEVGEHGRQEEAAPVAGIVPTKSIVISAKESYLYFGAVVDGLRQGRGRTQMPNGYTAYEGEYRDDKRDGFGVYYYQSGDLCYVGDWKDNKRSGLGVSFRQDGSGIHVGRWKDDTAVGAGSVYDTEGNLRYAGRLENGVRQGAGVSCSVDGSVFVGKWKNNKPTGSGSAFDCDGNLIYTGGWVDGKRCGMGTEYSPEGAVLFVGSWEDDRRVSGVVYENGVPKPYGG